MTFSFKEAFVMPFTSISKKILCEDLIPLFPHPSSLISVRVPMSVSYYKVSCRSKLAFLSNLSSFCYFILYYSFWDSMLYLVNSNVYLYFLVVKFQLLKYLLNLAFSTLSRMPLMLFLFRRILKEGSSITYRSKYQISLCQILQTV